MKKLAVIFPGVGYHADKPLLYQDMTAMIDQIPSLGSGDDESGE